MIPEVKLFRRELFHGGVQAGLATGGIVFLDDIFFRGLVERLLRLQEPFFGQRDVGLGDRITRAFDGALDHTLDGAVAEGVLGSDSHVLLG